MKQRRDRTSVRPCPPTARLAAATLLGASTAIVVTVLVLGVVQPVAASGEAASATHGPDLIHTLFEVLQLFAGAAAVVTAYLGVQTMRGGHMEEAFYSLTAGVVAFLVQRFWHSLHEFGFVPLPGLVEQLLLLAATVLMATGFFQTYRIMNPSS